MRWSKNIKRDKMRYKELRREIIKISNSKLRRIINK